MTDSTLRFLPLSGLRVAGLLLGALLLSSPASATSFYVVGYEFGEVIDLTIGRSVQTSLLDVEIDGTPGQAFSIDLEQTIGIGSYTPRALLDPFADASPGDELPRDLVWAGLVMENFGFDVDALVSATVTRAQAITGIQAAIWEGLYGATLIKRNSLSAGALSVFEIITSAEMDPTGGSLIVEMQGVEDQITTTRPIPEPSAALVFAIGFLIVICVHGQSRARARSLGFRD